MRAAAFRSGILSILPLMPGIVPFGMIYGVMAIQAGIPILPAQAMSAIVFAGSSQFIAAQLISGAAPAGVIVLTIFVVNLRHMLYSASLAPYFEKLSAGWKALLAYVLVDEAYAVSITHFREHHETPLPHWYFLGAGVTLWVFWQSSTALGILLGAQVPASWSLDFTLALTFIALLAQVARDKPSLAAAAAGGLAALLFAGLPLKLGLVAAAAVGILTGLIVEKRWNRSG